MKKKILSLLLAATCVLSLAACGGSKDDSNELVMATNAEFPPYEYYEGKDIVGIDVEIAEAIAENLGMELKIEDMAFESVVTSVATKKSDIGLAGMTVEPDRLESVNFSEPYATAAQVIIVKEGSDIQTPEDLVGKTIGGQIGTVGVEEAAKIEGTTVERYNKGFEAVQALSQGKIDAVIIDNEPAKEFVKQTEGLVILDKELTKEEYAIAINKEDTELLEKINAAIAELKESGKLDEIVLKYIPAE